ncbi:hypothetical protein TSUD_116330 [Trifolium subterraneum]|uniref:F-box domain-containing protein n=1 Tax=Trifolium subterraneum TaxID=3900 RepID=A0A2Z6M217_TRISU|nr:hypothetical protein TSUD_116330 [Trifolium subterraneum]
MAKCMPLPTLPFLPFDLIQEILCRLSVKFLVQLRCVCKSWNYLISVDTKFANKHLDMSTTFGLHFLRSSESLRKYILKSFPFDSVLSTVIPDSRRLEFPVNCYPDRYHCVVGSCNGIICIACFWDNPFVLMWNPSIRKFKELPRIQSSQSFSHLMMTHGFGYDHVTHNYKAVVVIQYRVFGYLPDKEGLVNKTEVKVHTFGTDFWKDISEFPSGGVPIEFSGKFVSGAINWLVKHGGRKHPYFIVSFDLGSESYQKILLPDYGEIDMPKLSLSVLRDCLCMVFYHDVWVMKEYGHTKSWTKLFTVSYAQDPNMSYNLTRVIYMFEDDQVLLELKVDRDSHEKLIVYDPRINTFKFTNYLNKSRYASEVCVESLISP